MRPKLVAILKQFEKSLKNCPRECVQYSLFLYIIYTEKCYFSHEISIKKKNSHEILKKLINDICMGIWVLSLF